MFIVPLAVRGELLMPIVLAVLVKPTLVSAVFHVFSPDKKFDALGVPVADSSAVTVTFPEVEAVGVRLIKVPFVVVNVSTILVGIFALKAYLPSKSCVRSANAPVRVNVKTPVEVSKDIPST